jgi:hypothetical protein
MAICKVPEKKKILLRCGVLFVDLQRRVGGKPVTHRLRTVGRGWEQALWHCSNRHQDEIKIAA